MRIPDIVRRLTEAVERPNLSNQIPAEGTCAQEPRGTVVVVCRVFEFARQSLDAVTDCGRLWGPRSARPQLFMKSEGGYWPRNLPHEPHPAQLRYNQLPEEQIS